MRYASTMVLFVCTFFPVVAAAQVQTGTPAFGTFAGGPDTIDLANLNSTIVIPVLRKAGRGMDFTFSFVYDSSVWVPLTSSSSTSWNPSGAGTWGWTMVAPRIGYVRRTETIQQDQCTSSTGRIGKTTLIQYFWSYYDNNGLHEFGGSSGSFSNGCTGQNSTFVLTNDETTDGSGYTLSASGNTLQSLHDSKGDVLNPPINPGTFAAGSTQDQNGNAISESSAGVFTDTLGTNVLTIAGSVPTLTYSYTAPSGAQASYTVKYTAYTVKTNFGCSGVGEFGPTSENLISEIDLPDNDALPGGDKYTFSYEPTPGFAGDVTGRLASVTLPTGGTISYSYSGGSGGITCVDGSAAILTRTTPDTGPGHWTYSHSESASPSTTTVTDPLGNQTIYYFQSGIYQTERQIYSGTSTLLKTVFTCYNGASPNCNTAAIAQPITSQATYLQWPSGLESKAVVDYNVNGLPTEKDEYDYGNGSPGNLLRKTLTTYASLGNIAFEPASVTIQNGSGTTVAQTTYQYDQTAVTSTSGTPQHGSISGARGNVTTITYLTQGSASLSKTFTYFDTGNINVATDVNGAQTTYTYGACGNSFATNIAEPMGMSMSMTWDCTGGVENSATNENGKATSTTYTDAYFWRPASSADEQNNITNYTYANQNSVETSLVFNGNASTVDVLTTRDSLGRSHLKQTKQSPTSTTYDSVETDYDTLGRTNRITVPYSGAAGAGNSSAPATITTYDPASRPLTVTDGGGGTANRSYSANDTLFTKGPSTAGENPKRRQFEYNGIGQLTSVCEVTNLTGSGTCGQTSTATGYWTRYTYDVLGDLLTVSQNAQSSSQTQSRSYTYDGMKRITSETNPETGTIYYFYDTDPGTKGGANCSGIYNGDLIKRVDAAGNVTCYTYDAMHRKTSVSYAFGPNSGNTPNKYFVYDGATVNSAVMANAMMRMAEAYTATCQTCSKITDEGFSYTVRGEVSDVYESTPHSGGYFHVNEVYWANDAVNQVSGLTGLPTFTYGVDGEGRSFSTSASSGQNPVTSTVYNVASEATGVTFGSGDSEAFQFDANTFRMTQYKYTVGATPKTVVGNLTWNANGTLASLGITDAFNAANTQNCTYSYDDLARLASGNCGSVWAQTFSYDAFGNITKSGSMQFQPGYNLNNQMLTGTTYDPNGNVVSDSLHTFAYDSEARPTTISGLAVTYDALGRMVERSTPVEIVYAPSGEKLALMKSLTTIDHAFVSLPGGATAVYTSGGLFYYRYPDWLGSSRFSSTPGRAMHTDLAFAPYGEQYSVSGSVGVAGASFAGNNEDTTTNLYDAQFREYEIFGRWPSPDPSGVSAAHVRNPQTLNRYAYVANNPLSHADPAGTDFEHRPLPPADCPIEASTDCECDPGDIFCSGGGGGGSGGGGDGGSGGCGTEFGGDSGNCGGLPPPPPPPTESEMGTVCFCKRLSVVVLRGIVGYTCTCTPHSPTCSGNTIGELSWAALQDAYRRQYGSNPSVPPLRAKVNAIELEIDFLFLHLCTYTLTDIITVSQN